MQEPLPCPDLSRRRFLRLGLCLPFISASLLLPLSALAEGRADPIGHKLDSLQLEDKLNGEPPSRKPRAPRLLMIDPGHGGHDPGATGRTGLHEKDVTLDIARRMAEILAGKPETNVKLTRSEDVFISLPDRVKMSQAAHTDLFVSIHADSAPSRLAKGLSAYTLSEKASDSFSKALATQENRIEAMGGIDFNQTDRDVAAILMDLTARRTRNTSQRARFEFVNALGKNWNLLERPMRAANFAVLRAPDVPSFLVETGFLTNPQDEATLRQPQQRQKIAQLMADELSRVLGSGLFG